MTDATTRSPEPAESGSPLPVILTPSVRAAIKILALSAAFFTLYYARGFFLPLVLALVLALTLSPLVRLGQSLRIPAAVTATVLMLALGAGLIAAGASLATPIASWIDDAPRIGREVKDKLRALRTPIEAVRKAGDEVERMASAAEPGVQEVVVRQPGLVNRAADNLVAGGATALVTLVLALFLLINRDMFYLKIVRVLPTLTDRKRALQIARDIESEVSRYLLTISTINAALGAAVGAAMWAIGMPNPALWGLVAALLNFLPYIGGLVGIAVVGAVALITFDSLAYAALAPAAYLCLTALEGQFVTPLILGRRLELNTVMIFVAIAFWGFMWGVVGVILAVPLLIILKVFCDHVAGLAGLGEFLSGDSSSLD